MSITKPLLAACFVVALGYVAYPYVTLYRLGEALHRGDAKTLQNLVNWPAVRAGIKHDLCDRPEVTLAKGELPGFGASFVSGIATHAVEQQVTPESLVKVIHDTGTAAVDNGGMQVDWAFFDSPTQFQVSLRPPGRTRPIRLELRLHDTQWRVDRVWLPPDLLTEASART